MAVTSESGGYSETSDIKLLRRQYPSQEKQTNSKRGCAKKKKVKEKSPSSSSSSS